MRSTPSSLRRRPWTGRWSRSSRPRRRHGGRRTMWMSRPVRSTVPRSAAAAPPRQTLTPFIATSSRSGSNAARRGADRGEHPAPVRVVAEQRALEQVVAGDAAADLDRVVLGRRRRRPRCATSFVAPSASASSWRGQVGARRRAAPRRRRRRRASRRTRRSPAAARCRWSTCSRRRRRGRRSPRRRRAARVSSVAASTTASVVSTQSIVASAGASMPAPLAIPPTVHPAGSVQTAVLATVSVVRIASAASMPPSVTQRGGGRVDSGAAARPSPAARR